MAEWLHWSKDLALITGILAQLVFIEKIIFKICDKYPNKIHLMSPVEDFTKRGKPIIL